MIPAFVDNGYLPPGVHLVSWPDFVGRFGSTSRRRHLLAGMRQALLNLKDAGCRGVYIDGSFVTNKENPGDFDGCWDPCHVEPRALDPVLLDFRNRRAAQKAKYGGELFVADFAANAAGQPFMEFFQSDRDGVARGIVEIDLATLA